MRDSILEMLNMCVVLIRCGHFLSINYRVTQFAASWPLYRRNAWIGIRMGQGCSVYLLCCAKIK